MKQFVKSAVLFLLLPTFLLLTPLTNESRAQALIGSGLPMCATAGVTTKCIESVLVNGVALPDIGAQYNSTDPYFKVPNYTAPAGKNYSDLIVVNVSELSSLFNTTIGAPSNDRSKGIDPSWQISIRINFGQADLTYAMLRSQLTNYKLTSNDVGDTIVELTAYPTPTVWFNTNQDKAFDVWVSSCTAANATATNEYGPSVYLMNAKMPVSTPGNDQSGMRNLKGLLVSTNYGCGDTPIPSWDYKTSSMVIAPTAPHFKLDGSINTGFYSAIIPPTFILNEFGLSVEEMLGKSLSLTADYSSGSPVAIPLISSLESDGNVKITATEEFHYSAPKIRLKKKSGIKRGTTVVKTTSTITNVTRGSALSGVVKFSNVKSGKAFVYVFDNKNVSTFLGAVSIKNGKATLTSVIPKTLSVGKGKLLVSYSGSSKFARTKLTKKITIS